jgi:hypothetical protein
MHSTNTDNPIDFPPYYAMYTDAGNGMIHEIVVSAREQNLTWPQVYDILHSISEVNGFTEATDTAVRECVYDALGFETLFYI